MPTPMVVGEGKAIYPAARLRKSFSSERNVGVPFIYSSYDQVT